MHSPNPFQVALLLAEYHALADRRREIDRQREELAAEWELLGVRRQEIRRAVLGRRKPIPANAS